jgi:hypothetical protein
MKKNTIYLLFMVALVFVTPKLHAQYYDCNTAIRICDALQNDFSMSLDQIGANDLSNGNDGCLLGETNGSGWFYLETTSTGLLGFDLIASDINDDFTDVDFAVYGPFNMTELDNGTLCSVINSNTEPLGRSNPIRCSYADDLNYCFDGTNNTGLDSGVANDANCGTNTSEFSETSTGNGFVSSISATPGQVYMVYIDDFSGSTSNFTLTFSLLTHAMVDTQCGESPCTCANGGSCPGNHYADEASADAAYNAIVNEDDAPCYDLTPEGISTADGTYQFCYTYTTGATEEYMGAAMTAFLDPACINNGGITSNLMRLYPVVVGSCGTPIASAGTTPLGYSYYDVTPSTTYKLCQELTINPLTTGCDGGRFGSVCPLLFAYEPCFLTLGTETRTCNPEGTEYTLTVPFTGGGTRSYTITGATNSGDNPSFMATGTMSFGPFAQGTSYSINITGGTCDIDIVGSYTCIPPCDFAPETIADFSVTCGNAATLDIGPAPALYGFGDVSEYAGTCTEISNAGHTAVTLADDAVTADLSIGFPFNFFGNTYSQFRIHSNGFISFGGQTYTGYANFTIPNATDPDNFIAGLYGDLNPSCGGSITYATVGSSPNRQLIVTFSDIEPYDSGCGAPATEAVSFQIVLNEDATFNVIIIDYPPTYGSSSTIGSNVTSGYENADGTIADAATGYNGASGAWVDESAGATPVCWGAYPLTNPCVFDHWEDASGATIGTTASLSVTPAATTTYTAVWNCAGTECTDPLTVTVTGTPPTTTGATICTGGSGTLTSSTACPDVLVLGSPIAQGATFNSGMLTTTDARWDRNSGGTTCNGSATDDEYYDIFTFSVSANGSYTLNMCTPGTNWDGHASLYQNAFSDAAPCGVPGNFIIADDDGNSTGNCDNDARLTATLSTGITYYLITTEFAASGSNRAYEWTYTGPAGATISPATSAPGTLQWYTAATGGTPVQTGSPFNPVGDAEVIAAGAPYSSLTNTNTPGTYTFYAACSGAPNCRAATDFVINARPDAGLSNNGPICSGSSVTLTATPATGATYQWSAGATAGATNTATASPTSTATYTVTVTDSANNCTASSTTVVTVVAPPNAGTLSGTQNVCVGGTTTFTSNGDASGTWSSLNTAFATVDASGVVTGVAAGTTTITYTVTATSPCTNATATRTVTVTAPPTANAGSDVPTACSTAVTLGATGTGTWSGGAGTFSDANSPTSTYTPAAGEGGTTVTLTWTVAATAPCTVNATDQVDVTVGACGCAAPPSVIITEATAATCGTSAVTLNYTVANGPATVTTTGGGTLSTTSLANGTSTFTYTPVAGDVAISPITITASIADPDGTGPCTASTDNVSVTVTANPTPSITSSGANLCSPGSRTLAATPTGGTFSILSGPGSISGTTLTASGIGAIVVQYSVTVDGCTGTTTQTINTVACTRSITITDPCSCNNDASTSVNDTPALPVIDGTFDETIQIQGLFAGDVIDVISITGLYVSPGGAAYDPASAETALAATQTATDATLTGAHIDNVGYTIIVDVYDINGILVADDLSISNKCAYPNPDFSIGSFVDCATPIAITLTHSALEGAGNLGTASFSPILGGTSPNYTLAPAGLTGTQTISLTYTGFNDGLGGVSPDGGTTPAFPGCQEVIQRTIDVNCPACAASTNMQWGN